MSRLAALAGPDAENAGMQRAVIGWSASRDRPAFRGTMKQKQGNGLLVCM